MPPRIDLRSDTVTTPTPAMREAMALAVVGNASWGEDPTVRTLESRAAEATGKDAALFVPSGTMGNQIAIRVHTLSSPSPEIVCEARAHIYLNEAAGIATISHAQVRPLAGVRGQFPVTALKAALADRGILHPDVALVCLENTHNYAGGAVLPLAYMREVREVAHAHDVPVHLDGARVFNAAAALGVPVARVCEEVDTVQFCFSKGLGAPVGSVVCGSDGFIEGARKVRQYLGGAMRQSGVLAAPALVGLDMIAPKLGDDHRRARAYADALADIPGVRVTAPETNIVVIDVGETGRAPRDIAHALGARDVGLSVISATELRAVTYHAITDADVEEAARVTRDVLAKS